MTNIDDLVKEAVRVVETAVIAGNEWKKELKACGKFSANNVKFILHHYATTISAAVIRAKYMANFFKVFTVGGCLRDELMGIEPQDFDYVVCGATPEVMTKQGFKLVGKSFPVYQHPVTGDEWALARTESKREGETGYHAFDVSFSPSTTIVEDLARRDLTMNAMARCLKTGVIHDPFDGVSSIRKREIRAVSTTSFKEDPLRVIRALRFAARYDFEIHTDTFEAILEVVNTDYDLEAIPDNRHALEFRKVVKDAHDRKELGIVVSFMHWCLLACINGTDTFTGALTNLPAGEYTLDQLSTKFDNLQSLWDAGKITLTKDDIMNLVLGLVFRDQKVPLTHNILSQYADARTYARLFAIDSDKVSEIETYWEVVKKMKPWHDASSPLVRFGDLYISTFTGEVSTFFADLAGKLTKATTDDLLQLGFTGPELGKHLEARRKGIFIDHMIASM